LKKKTVQDRNIFHWDYLFVLLGRFLLFSLGSAFWNRLYIEFIPLSPFQETNTKNVFLNG
jgi:hypothetical protein